MKTLIKNILIPPFASRFASSLAIRIFGRGIPVFLLHRMTSEKNRNQGISAEHLQRCLQYLVDNGYHFIALQDVIHALTNNAPLPDKTVVFTMDDGFIDQAEIAAPIFLEYDCPLTFFVISGLLDQQLWPWDSQSSWIINNTKKAELNLKFSDETLCIKIDDTDGRHQARELTRNYLKEVEAKLIPSLLKQLAENASVSLPDAPPERCRAMSWDKARELEKQGIQFAPHSITHQVLSKLDRKSAEKEIIGSWQALQNELSNPVKLFCYPTGRFLDFGPREIEILMQNHFIGAVSTVPGYIELDHLSEKSLYSIHRFELPSNMTDFIQYCSWIEYAKHKEKQH